MANKPPVLPLIVLTAVVTVVALFLGGSTLSSHFPAIGTASSSVSASVSANTGTADNMDFDWDTNMLQADHASVYVYIRDGNNQLPLYLDNEASSDGSKEDYDSGVPLSSGNDIEIDVQWFDSNNKLIGSVTSSTAV